MQGFEIMPRGGKREGAGRKPAWKHQPTKPIKVPIALADDIIKIAKLLDSGEISISEILGIVVVRSKDKITKLAELNSKNTEIETNIKVTPPPTPSSSPTVRGDVKLTPSQSAAIALMQQFVTGKSKYFRLTGYAGTGKSFLVCEFMKWLRNRKINFVAGSPTNKAVKNLKNLANLAGLGEIEANTVAQLLGQQPVLNENTGVEEFKSRQLKPSVGDYDLAIIDEFSMLNEKNFYEILNEVEFTDTKIIFVGDRAQLPPVGEKEPIVATSELIRDSYTLTEVVRYDGQIGKVAEQIRSNSKYDRLLYPFETTADRTVIKLDRTEWLDVAVDYFDSDEFKNNPDYCRFLVWRNKTAFDLNAYLRSKLWGDDCPAYVVGDRMIAKTPVFRPVAGGKGKNKWAIAMNNSEECQVTSSFQLKNFDVKRYQHWQYYNVPVVTDSGLKLDLKILTDASEKERAKELERLRKAKQWKTFTTLSKTFDNVLFHTR